MEGKNSKQSQEKTKGVTPSVVTSPNQSVNPGLGASPEAHTTGNSKIHHTSTVYAASDDMPSHKFPTKTVPYHVQTHVVNLTDQNNNFHVIELPIRLHAHLDLPLPEVNVSTSLNRQQASDIHGNKASNIHNSGTYQWGAFSKCSVTCGEGVKKRYRKCTVEKCTAPGIETQVVPCTSSTCPGMMKSFLELY